eukprot:1159038-Pelagomonas_calceolata.AAC.5
MLQTGSFSSVRRLSMPDTTITPVFVQLQPWSGALGRSWRWREASSQYWPIGKLNRESAQPPEPRTTALTIVAPLACPAQTQKILCCKVLADEAEQLRGKIL